MQTVIVTAERHEKYTILKVDEVGIAEIDENRKFKGKYNGWVYGFSGNDGSCTNYSFPEALEYVSYVIEVRFKRLGLNVEFK